MPVKVTNKKSPVPKDAPVETKPAPVETKPEVVEAKPAQVGGKAKGKAPKAEAKPVEAPKVEAPVEAKPVEAKPVEAPVAQAGGAKVAKAKAAPKVAKAKAAKAAPKAKVAKAKAAPKAKAAKAAPKAKVAKGKAVTETADENSEELEGGKRSFKAMLPGSDKFEGRYTGLTPYQAANKALSKYYRESTGSVSEITFSIRESTRGSKRTVYTYNGRREKLATPVEYTIKGKDGERTVVKEYKNRLTKVKKADVETATTEA